MAPLSAPAETNVEAPHAHVVPADTIRRRMRSSRRVVSDLLMPTHCQRASVAIDRVLSTARVKRTPKLVAKAKISSTR